MQGAISAYNSNKSRIYTKANGNGVRELFLDNNTSKVETIITIIINMGRQRKPHRKSHEGCEQCKDRHIKVRRRGAVSVSLSPAATAITSIG